MLSIDASGIRCQSIASKKFAKHEIPTTSENLNLALLYSQSFTGESAFGSNIRYSGQKNLFGIQH